MIIQVCEETNWHEVIDDLEDLHLKEPLLRGVLEWQSRLSPIMSRALKPILSGRDAIIRNGFCTGNMLLMLTSALQRIDTSLNATQAIFLVPARELCWNITSCFASIGRYMDAKLHINIASHETEKFKEDLEVLKSGPHVVATTPGRLYDMIRRRRLRPDSVKMIFFFRAEDELYRHLAGTISQTFRILPQDVQIVALGESSRPEEGLEERFMGTRDSEPVRIVLKSRRLPWGSRHFFIEVAHEHVRYILFSDLLAELELQDAVPVFCASAEQASDLAAGISRDVINAVVYSDEVSPGSESAPLPAGIDSSQVNTQVTRSPAPQQRALIINYDSPQAEVTYCDRLDRILNPRDRDCAVINLVSSTEMEYLKRVEQVFRVDMRDLSWDLTLLSF
ncbi:hypothetical protein NLG97_g6749 [Lecanicillium saksenae]|uniref:Uncharacterized protein n=1 Tax=Lecanicillium saksenae TaxID=468837 RepID=A0ACC1QQ16_9HYPO|nr:hypothetical protein NLG97_g6749 [Lecanicillium saksenae]